MIFLVNEQPEVTLHSTYVIKRTSLIEKIGPDRQYDSKGLTIRVAILSPYCLYNNTDKAIISQSKPIVADVDISGFVSTTQQQAGLILRPA
jgi:hypothetical protein